MKFGPVPVAEAEGAIAVHSIRQAGLVLKKGTVIGKAEIAALRAELADRGEDLPIYFGNRNWEPYVEDTVAAVRTCGATRCNWPGSPPRPWPIGRLAPPASSMPRPTRSAGSCRPA